MTPLQLDYIINGAKVFLYRRPHDGHVYASLDDYSRFGVGALETVRVPLNEDSTADGVLNHPSVLKRVAHFDLTSGVRT